MGFQLAQNLKFLKKQMQNWRIEVFGNLIERQNMLLDNRSIDRKEETRVLEEAVRERRKSSQEQFSRLVFLERN